jgi:hypothetical protein
MHEISLWKPWIELWVARRRGKRARKITEYQPGSPTAR